MNGTSRARCRRRCPGRLCGVLRWRRLALGALLVVGLEAGAQAELSAPPLPTPEELAALDSLTRKGLVALVEPPAAARRAKVVLVGRVDAPASSAFDALARPEDYPSFMPAMEHVVVSARRGRALAYTWRWRVATAPWRGRCAMALAPPHDVAVNIVESDLGVGAFRWRFYPSSSTDSLAAEAVTLDVAEAHPVLRYLLGRGEAMPSAVTLTVATVLMEGARLKAAQLAGRSGQRPSGRGGRADRVGATDAEVSALGPLLGRGAVVLLESSPEGDLRRVTVAEAVDVAPAQAVKLLRSPTEWPGAVPVLSRLDVEGSDPRGSDVRLGVNLSLFKVSGDARLDYEADGVSLTGTGGGVRRTRLRFQARPGAKGGTVLVASGSADLARASFWLRRLLDREPYFNQGINSAAQLVFVRGLAAELRRRAASGTGARPPGGGERAAGKVVDLNGNEGLE